MCDDHSACDAGVRFRPHGHETPVLEPDASRAARSRCTTAPQEERRKWVLDRRHSKPTKTFASIAQARKFSASHARLSHHGSLTIPQLHTARRTVRSRPVFSSRVCRGSPLCPDFLFSQGFLLVCNLNSKQFGLARISEFQSSHKAIADDQTVRESPTDSLICFMTVYLGRIIFPLKTEGLFLEKSQIFTRCRQIKKL